MNFLTDPTFVIFKWPGTKINLTSRNLSGLIMNKTVSNIAQLTEINQGNQNIFDHSGAKWIQTSKFVLDLGHLGVVQHTQVKKLGIGLNFIEIRGGPMFVLRIQEHLNQVTQDLWPPLLWPKCCQNSNCLTKTAHVMSKWPEKIKVWLLGLYLGSEFGKRTNSGAKTPNLRFLGINFSKLSLTLSLLWANFQVQGVDLQS